MGFYDTMSEVTVTSQSIYGAAIPVEPMNGSLEAVYASFIHSRWHFLRRAVKLHIEPLTLFLQGLWRSTGAVDASRAVTHPETLTPFSGLPTPRSEYVPCL